MIKHKIEWKDILKMCEKFTKHCKKNNLEFTDVVAIARGGMIPAQLIAYRLGIERIHNYGIKSYKGEEKRKPLIYQSPEDLINSDILVIDEVCDSGETFEHVTKDLLATYDINTMTTFCLHWKPCSTYKPDHFGAVADSKVWIVYPWDIDE